MLVKKIFLITFPNSSRSKYYTESNSHSKKHLTFFNAIDTREDPLGFCSKYGIKINIMEKWKKYFLSNSGSFGCTISHVELWKKISSMKKGDFVCVCEDDISVDSLEKLINTDLRSIDSDITSGKIINITGWAFDLCSAGYLIDSAGAKYLLKEFNQTIIAPQDKFMFEVCFKKNPELFKWNPVLKFAEHFKNTTL